MNKPLFIETIKVKDGIYYNLPLHLKRMRETIDHFFGSDFIVNIPDIPEDYRAGLVKCRILYNSEIVSVEYQPYIFREIKKLCVIRNNNIDYQYKFFDRQVLNDLCIGKDDCSDILIVKNGWITDSSFTNFVFENEQGLFTPKTYLLNGTKRQQLLQTGRINEKSIGIHDLEKYKRVYLINSMIDLEDGIFVPVSNIERIDC